MKGVMFRISFAAVLLSLSLGASAQEQDICGIRFTGDPLPSKWLQKMVPVLEYEYGFYSALGADSTFSVTVHAFRDRKHGYSYMSSHYGKNSWQSESGVRIAGCFIPSENLIGIFGFGDDVEFTAGLIFHELSHSLFNHVYPERRRKPMWLNEGLAEYFAGCISLRRGGVRHVLDDDDKGRLKTKLQLGEIDIPAFLDSGRKEFMQMEYTDDMSAYRLSHAIVAFMLELAPEGYFRQVFRTVADPSERRAPSVIVAETYPGGMEAFIAGFHKFIDN